MSFSASLFGSTTGPLAAAGGQLSTAASTTTGGLATIQSYTAASCAGSPTVIFASTALFCPKDCAASTLTSASISTTCITTTSFANAATAFGAGATYAGKVLYSDDGCTTEIGASFIKADGACYSTTDVNGFVSSASATVSGAQVVVRGWPTKDCSGTSTDATSFGTSKCSGKTGSVVVVNGATVSGAQATGAPRSAAVVAALAAFVGLLAAVMA